MWGSGAKRNSASSFVYRSARDGDLGKLAREARQYLSSNTNTSRKAARNIFPGNGIMTAVIKHVPVVCRVDTSPSKVAQR